MEGTLGTEINVAIHFFSFYLVEGTENNAAILCIMELLGLELVFEFLQLQFYIMG